MGMPAKLWYCLGSDAPKREPLPAAGRITVVAGDVEKSITSLQYSLRGQDKQQPKQDKRSKIIFSLECQADLVRFYEGGWWYATH